jgi:type IX secretion system PorP/SprF family membrane protein
MKRSLALAAGMLVVTFGAYAQLRPQFTQYMLNYYTVNPAFMGANNFTDVRAGYRKQWTGITGSPETFYASAHGSIEAGQSHPPVSLPVRGRLSNQFSTGAKSSDEGSSAKHGIGGMVMADRTGPSGFNAGYVSYAYHIPVAAQTYFSFGLMVGASQFFIDYNKLELQDRAIGTGMVSNLYPDVNLGGMLYGEKYFVGYSLNQLLRNEVKLISDNKTAVARLPINHFISAGYKIGLNDALSLVPSVLVKYSPESPISFDVNARLNIKEMLWIGAAFRNQDAFSGLVGVHLSDMLSFGYGYDFTTSKLNTFSNGSHEVVLSGRLFKKNKSIVRPSMW